MLQQRKEGKGVAGFSGPPVTQPPRKGAAGTEEITVGFLKQVTW